MPQPFHSWKIWPHPFVLAVVVIFLFPSLSFGRGGIANTSPNGAYLLLLSRNVSDINPYRILESSAKRLAVKVSLPDLVIEPIPKEDGLTYHLLLASGAGSTGEVGYPRIPAYCRNILIPNGMEAKIVVKKGEPAIYTNILAYPLQEPAVHLDRTVIPAFYRDKTAYASPGFYPGYFAKLLDDGVMRGQRMANLWVYPYQYDPSSKVLRVYRDLEVTVEFSGDIKDINPRYRSKSFNKLYHELAINADEILEAQKKVAEVPGPFEVGPYGWDYLIFTVADFSAAANDLAAWKRKMGFRPLVIIIPPQWTAADIRNKLMAAYLAWDIPPVYVLLLGDAEFIPTNYDTWHDYNLVETDNTQGAIGTDLYYSLLESADPWDPLADLKPEVWLGRISVDEPYQAQDRVDAIINYESSPPVAASFYNSVIMAAMFQDGGTFDVVIKGGTGKPVTTTFTSDGIADRRFAQTTEDIAIFLSENPQNKTITRLYWADPASNPSKWNDNKQTMQEGDNWDGLYTKVSGNLPNYLLRSSGFNWNAQAPDITNAINKGAFLVTHRDHGGTDRWTHPLFKNIDVFLLNNTNLPPVVWSLNCQTGWFDNETDFKSKTGLTDHTASDAVSFSEYWERPFGAAITDDDYGAIGVVAATRVTYGVQNDRLMMGMVDAIWPSYLSKYGAKKARYEMAAVLYQGKAYMSNTTSNSSWGLIEHETMHWFGDPSMQIRTEVPPLMVVLPPDNWPLALVPNNLTIKIEKSGGSDLRIPMPDAKVTLLKTGVSVDQSSGAPPPSLGTPEHWVAYTDREGNAEFPDLRLSSTGDYQIITSAPNHIPGTVTFTSRAGSAGGIQLDKPGYRCDQDVTVSVADIDLEGNSTVAIYLESSKVIDGETMVLTNVGQGTFQGTISISDAAVTPEDGTIQTEDGDTLIAYYQDGNNGTGSATVTSEALMDCQPPTFEGIKTIEKIDDACLTVKLHWEEAIDPHGPINYTIYRATQFPDLIDPVVEMIGSSNGITYLDSTCLSLSNYDYFYRISAIDRLGNEDTNNNWMKVD